MHIARHRLLAFGFAAAALCGPAFGASDGAGAAPLSFRQPTAASPGESSSVAVLLALGLAVGGGALVALRSGSWRSLRLRRPASQRASIERLSTQMLAKGASLHAVRWHGEELLIGCTDREVTLLARRQAGSASQEAQ
jgi:hypothetical protein